MNPRLCLFALLLVACGKEVPSPATKAKVAAVAPQPVPAKPLPPTPQGELPKMDPAKAKFIAVPSTPEDTEVKGGEKPKGEGVKGASAASTAVEVKPAKPGAAEVAVPEVKRAAPATEVKKPGVPVTEER